MQRGELPALHDRTRAEWSERARATADESPISTARLASAVWEAIRAEDWVLTAGTASDWALRLWDFDRPYRHAGRSLGTATQIGISLGVALSHRDAGRLVVDLQPDGDLMFDLGALWVASYHRIPMLVVMFNNRAYYNDWEHQERMARRRGTPVENSWIGMELERSGGTLRDRSSVRTTSTAPSPKLSPRSATIARPRSWMWSVSRDSAEV
jgi:acetolactate synthase-1/2/3 large subunit